MLCRLAHCFKGSVNGKILAKHRFFSPFFFVLKIEPTADFSHLSVLTQSAFIKYHTGCKQQAFYPHSSEAVKNGGTGKPVLVKALSLTCS